ncbi:hypothetical protein [Streptomyces wuyuanensis]|uniref:hypothetical protein n=1 Tax=Streptomyces wuyuanensis TaxID=1196353 RepID=UPI003717F835
MSTAPPAAPRRTPAGRGARSGSASVTGTSEVLGDGLPVGEAPVLPPGLGEVGAVGEGDGTGRPVEGRALGPALTAGGALSGAGAGVRAAGGRGGEGVARGSPGAPPSRSRAAPLAGWVAGRSGAAEAVGRAVPCSRGPSEDGRSGLGAACGRPAEPSASREDVPRPPSTAKAAAARVRPPYVLHRRGPGRRAGAVTAAGAVAAGPGGVAVPAGAGTVAMSAGDPSGAVGSSVRISGMSVAGIGIPPVAATGIPPVAVTGISPVGAIAESYAPHSGHVTAPLRVRWQGTQ